MSPQRSPAIRPGSAWPRTWSPAALICRLSCRPDVGDRRLCRLAMRRGLCGRPLAGQYDRTARAARRKRAFFTLAHQNAAPCSTPRGERARRLVGALLAPTPPESHGAQRGATAPRDSAAGAQPRAGPPASAGGTSMASTHPLPRSSTVAHVLSTAGVDGLRTMRLHRVLDQLLTITVRRPCWSPTWCGARSDRALRSAPTYVEKLRSVALLCPAYVAALAAGHHGCALACQAPL